MHQLLALAGRLNPVVQLLCAAVQHHVDRDLNSSIQDWEGNALELHQPVHHQPVRLEHQRDDHHLTAGHRRQRRRAPTRLSCSSPICPLTRSPPMAASRWRRTTCRSRHGAGARQRLHARVHAQRAVDGGRAHPVVDHTGSLIDPPTTPDQRGLRLLLRRRQHRRRLAPTIQVTSPPNGTNSVRAEHDLRHPVQYSAESEHGHADQHLSLRLQHRPASGRYLFDAAAERGSASCPRAI